MNALEELTRDTDLHSVRADLHEPGIWDALKGVGIVDKVEGSLRRAAQLRKDVDEAEKLLARLCERIDQSRDECEAIGVSADFKLGPPMAAAYGAWKAQGPVERRVEVAKVTEAPLPPEGVE